MKSLLLGSAAGLCAVAGAQAADLPVRKAAPVEYVRVCSAHGAGFFYIPGTDTCLRVGGRARFEYQYTQNYNRNSDQSGYRGLGRIQLDARTSTAYGTLRTFVRFEIASRTGGYLRSGTQERYSNAFFGTGQDTFGRAQKYVNVDKAFVQFAGFTAGVASSFFDFYAHDLELIASSIGSDVSSTNLLAYTATFGNGFSATASMEDPTFRRNAIAAGGGVGGFSITSSNATGVSNGNIILGSSSYSPVAITRDAAGNPLTVSELDVVQRNRMPDFVGNLRWDQPWGSAQVSGAVHELAVGKFSNSGLTAPTGTTFAAATAGAAIPDNSYGFAVQGGLKINLPQIAPGDVLWLQAAYASGAGSYTGIYSPQGQETQASGNTALLGSGLNTGASGFDAAVDSAGRIHQTESYSATIAFLHYWTPEIRQGVFGTWGRAHFDNSLRSSTLSPLIGQFGLGNYGSAVSTTNGASAALNTFAKDYNNIYVGSNLIWSPVRDLDIGVEAVYQRIEFMGNGLAGRFIDQSKLGSGKTQAYEDNVMVRMRVQRDF